MKTESFVTAAQKVWNRAGDGFLAVGLFTASLYVYSQTLAPSVASLFDDSLEFPLVAYRLAIAHPTGYPLYTLLGKLFSLGPFPNVAWAVNFLSAAAAALTVALVYLVTRQLSRRRLPSLLGAIALAASPVFWSQSVIAEVYTLNSAFVAGTLLLVLLWARRPLVPVKPFSLLHTPAKERPSRLLPGSDGWLRLPLTVRQVMYHGYAIYRRFLPPIPPRRRLQPHAILFVLAVSIGLSQTHHRTALLLVPALFVFVLLVERRTLSRAALLGPEHPGWSRWRQLAQKPIVLLFVCLLVPLLLYLYLPIRGHVGSLDGTYANTWLGFWRWVTTGGYSVFLGDNPLARRLDAAFYAELFWQQFGPVGLALALVGWLSLLRQPKVLVLTSLAFLTYTGFAVIYRVPDVEVFFIPAVLLVAVWIGVGVDYAADLLHPRGRSMAGRRLLAACGVLLILVAIIQPLVIARNNYPDLDVSQSWGVHDYGLYVLEQPLPSGSTVVGLLGEMTLLRYFQDTAGLRPDIGTVDADDEVARREAVSLSLLQDPATFITRPLPGMDSAVSLGSVIGLIDVAGERETLIQAGEPEHEAPSMPHSTELEPLSGLRLLGYGIHEHWGHWQAWLRLRLWWQTTEGLEEPFKISARLIDADGHVVASTDAEPVAWAYPPNGWQPGEVVADAYEIPIPSGTPPGDYAPLVIVYEPETGIELGRAELAPIRLEGNLARPPRWSLKASLSETPCALFGDAELLGFTPPDPKAAYHPGDRLPLELLWQAQSQPSGELRMAVWLEAESSVLLAVVPVGGRFTADQWSDGDTVRQWPSIHIPGNTPPGTYRLKMRVTRDGQPVPWGCWLLPRGSDLELGLVQVEE